MKQFSAAIAAVCWVALIGLLITAGVNNSGGRGNVNVSDVLDDSNEKQRAGIVIILREMARKQWPSDDSEYRKQASEFWESQYVDSRKSAEAEFAKLARQAVYEKKTAELADQLEN